eukprot:GHVN01034548.1.p2 GENE.GHVN01034548.1~~GHVN01034548.1.p2  ORF type:complete len:463 (-),score=60.47 GHVN01034548.1:4780-6168(-)
MTHGNKLWEIALPQANSFLQDGSANRRANMSLDFPMPTDVEMDVFDENVIARSEDGHSIAASPAAELPSPVGIGGTPNSKISTPRSMFPGDHGERMSDVAGAATIERDREPLELEESTLQEVLEPDARVSSQHARAPRAPQKKMFIDHNTTIDDGKLRKWRQDTDELNQQPNWPSNRLDLLFGNIQNPLTHLSCSRGSLSLLYSRLSSEVSARAKKRPRHGKPHHSEARVDAPQNEDRLVEAEQEVFDVPMPDDETIKDLHVELETELPGVQFDSEEPEDAPLQATPRGTDNNLQTGIDGPDDDELSYIILSSQVDGSIRRTPRRPHLNRIGIPVSTTDIMAAATPEPLQEEQDNADEEISVGYSSRTLRVLSFLRDWHSRLSRKQSFNDAGEVAISFCDLSKRSSRDVAAPSFFEVLVLKTRGFVDVSQAAEEDGSMGDVKVFAGRRFFTDPSQATPLRGA